MAKRKYARKRAKRSFALPALILSALAVVIAVSVILAVNGDGDILKTPSDNSSGSLPPVSSEPTEPYVVSSATVVNTGDLLMHDPIITGAAKDDGTYDFSDIFSAVSPYFTKADLAVANLEVTFGGTESGKYAGYPCFNLPDSLADAVKTAGIDLLLTANNHSYDTGLFGLKRTVQVLKQKQIDYIGTRESADEPTYTVKNVNGINIGMVCYTYENVRTTPGRKSINGRLIAQEANPLLSSFAYEDLDGFYSEAQTVIDGMKNGGADCIVFYMHWGEEYQLTQNSWQEKIAQKLCDLGVDIIVGGHPHVVQPVELLTSTDGTRKTVCVYSMGNAVSNQRVERMTSCRTGHTEDGMLFYYTLQKYSDGHVILSSVDIIPTWVELHRENGKSKYVIYALENADDGKTKYGFDDATAKRSSDSFARTAALVTEGIAECRTHLQNEPYFVNARPISE